ncbi:MAG: hypothetical protein J6N21_07070 [Butyrivibrio sp.]|nr:hypothetical protein [Butyrivibrio sp.]
MNMKLARRLLAFTMAASLVVMPLTVGATDSAQPSSSDSSVTTEQAAAVETTSQVAAGGQVVKNQLPGAFAIQNDPAVSGIAVTKTPDQIKASAGLGAGQTPFVKGYTLDPNKSNLAFASFEAGAAQVGGRVLGGINLDFGALTDGKYTQLPEGVTIPVTLGIKNYNPNLTYYIVKVSKGGKVELIPCEVVDGMIKFEATGGLSAYGLIAK